LIGMQIEPYGQLRHRLALFERFQHDHGS
jgi:hypothetical protein